MTWKTDCSCRGPRFKSQHPACTRWPSSRTPLLAFAGSRNECGISTELVVAIIIMIIIATVIMITEVEVLFGVPTNVAFIQTSPMKKRDQSVPLAYGLTMRER